VHSKIHTDRRMDRRDSVAGRASGVGLMLFASTRNRENTAAFAEALLKGLSPDGGLYVPHAWARLEPQSFGSEADLPGIANRLLAPFVEGDAFAAQLSAVPAEAFNFPAPLVSLE